MVWVCIVKYMKCFSCPPGDFPEKGRDKTSLTCKTGARNCPFNGCGGRNDQCSIRGHNDHCCSGFICNNETEHCVPDPISIPPKQGSCTGDEDCYPGCGCMNGTIVYAGGQPYKSDDECLAGTIRHLRDGVFYYPSNV